MKRKMPRLLFVVDLTVFAGFLLLPKSKRPSGPGGAMAEFLKAFRTPIEIHGRVVDQHGDPVPAATVDLYPVDAPYADESKSSLKLVSDSEGKFSARGLRGAALGVHIGKEGYLEVPHLDKLASTAMIFYPEEKSEGKRYSNPSTPLTMMLHKIGPVEPQFYIKETRWRLELDGTARRIALDTKVGKGTHEIEFRLWSDLIATEAAGRLESGPFDWTFEARIPGGGFAWSDSDFNFQAPDSGYKETIRYHYPASLPPQKWKKYQKGRYFVKFADGTYGRVYIYVNAWDEPADGPVAMQSLLILKPGSRNLASPSGTNTIFQGEDPEKE